ncbi:DUF3667 domain-containing protein [Longitalea luteola]|uniref:DUF3667 domain-containing protein n=1 Tax=Longitalea luteola TaxID=2812563 RepID=UPI001A963819|nr:DUF3667 domain-containing protein [Longitalea luteola]
MSHSKERHEKICLNCNAELHGRYCHKCGQENIEPKETVWGLITHFFYDITHYDGKFFSTTRYLITRPGFLPKEYLEGRRARYLHPIRMYVFSSAVFFIIFYSMFSFNMLDRKREKKEVEDAELTKHSLDSARLKALGNAKNSSDSAVIEDAFTIAMEPYVAKLEADTAGKSEEWKENYRKKLERREKRRKERYSFNLVNPDQKYRSIAQYDSAQKKLPADERDNWIARKAKHREIALHARYNGNQRAMLKDLLQKFTHTLPYLLFVSLPLYALYLKLLYIRRRQFLYVTHGIFLIYLYIFTFIDLLVYFGLMKIRESMHWNWIGWLEAAVLLYGVWYAYKAMRKFYGQGRGKTLLKFFILNTLASLSLLFLFTAFFLFAVFKF